MHRNVWEQLLSWMKQAISFLKRALVWVDSGYSGENFARVVQQFCGATVEVIQRIAQTFEILPKRWIVERTFGWLNRYRRLSKDYELHSESSEAMIYGSLIRLMLRRLAI